MGWASGSTLFGTVIGTIKANVRDINVREKIYEGLIDAFEGQDCDTLYECQGADKAFDKAWNKKYPPE